VAPAFRLDRLVVTIVAVLIPVMLLYHRPSLTGEFMAKPNYAHQKKQREEAARKKREEKQQRRQQKKDEAPPPPG
jgi:hypothetical protein